MPSRSKTDNHDAGAKLALRRRFLETYHAGARFGVFDCCQGSGLLWKILRRDFPCDYWGVDLKKAPGRLQVDSTRVLELQGQVADVIDVDAYGSPWGHYTALLPNVVRPATVFLTEGSVRMNGVAQASNDVLEAAGLASFPTLRPPRPLAARAVAEDGCLRMIAAAWGRGLRVVEVVEALNPGGNARYFGVRLEPASWGSGTP